MGVLTSAQRMIVFLELKGGPVFTAGVNKAAASMERFTVAQRRAALATNTTNKRTFAQNQLLFTGRRLLFGTTLALLGVGIAAVKMGFSYQSAMQTAKVALDGLFQGNQLQTILDQLFKIAALSPFLFKDVTVAFRTMFIGFRGVGISAGMTVKVIQSITDALAVAGKTAPAQMNRVAVALQHMAYQGRLTGYTINQLARDGLPIFDILNKELGVTGDQLHHISTLNIPTQKVLEAIVHYLSTTKPFAGAAERISNETLTGALAQFKDILGKSAAGGTGGIFSFLQRTLAGVNTQLQPYFKADKPISITLLARAFDKELTPKTHIILNVTVMLVQALVTLKYMFGGILYVVQQLLRPFDYLFNIGGQNVIVYRALGFFVGILVGLWALERLNLMRLAIWKEVNLLIDFVQIRYTKLLTFFTWLQIAAFLVWTDVIKAQMIPAMIALGRTIIGQIYGIHAALLTLELDPIVLLISAVVLLAVGFALLYWRWKAFRDIVNKTVIWLFNHPMVALFVPVVGQFILMARAAKSVYEWGVKIKEFFSHPIRVTLEIIKKGGGWNILKNLYEKVNPYSPITRAIKIAQHPTDPGSYIPDPTGLLFPKKSKGAKGGTVTTGGMAMVGEGGPEILTIPTFATITPFNRGAAPNFPKFPEVLNLKTVLRVDGKDLATVVAQHRLDAEARR